MSSSIVPSLYEAIVDEVVNHSRQDFQEDGIDEATLQEFKTRWAQKIAATGATAAFEEETDVKDDPDGTAESLTGSSNGGIVPQGGNALAAMRAAQQIQQLQARSNGSIQQHQADTAVAQLMQQAQQSSPSGQVAGQADSESNGTAVKQEPDVPSSLNPADLLQTGESSSPSKKRTLSHKSEAEDRPAQKSKKERAPRGDLDLDDEAINSDLDDSDDDALRAEGDEDEDRDMQTVLCLYDKVQRTKNKWKCVLKDGIVNVNGRDFAFNRANGEFEW